jgi:hypothetical protein
MKRYILLAFLFVGVDLVADRLVDDQFSEGTAPVAKPHDSGVTFQPRNEVAPAKVTTFVHRE